MQIAHNSDPDTQAMTSQADIDGAAGDDLYEVAVLAAQHEDGTRGWATVCSLPIRQVAEQMAMAHVTRVDIKVEVVQIRRKGVVVADYRSDPSW
ncbi:hypothetical protein [Nonomuraea lactucae]|uniref:hypothetical protein n=1 Tax=Nonomuraea lactucae TaxID=2249762 RepID=UPI000DE30A7E|nr:hypothetical protein [Nonomuraea lactucae]